MLVCFVTVNPHTAQDDLPSCSLLNRSSKFFRAFFVPFFSEQHTTYSSYVILKPRRPKHGRRRTQPWHPFLKGFSEHQIPMAYRFLPHLKLWVIVLHQNTDRVFVSGCLSVCMCVHVGVCVYLSILRMWMCIMYICIMDICIGASRSRIVMFTCCLRHWGYGPVSRLQHSTQSTSGHGHSLCTACMVTPFAPFHKIPSFVTVTVHILTVCAGWSVPHRLILCVCVWVSVYEGERENIEKLTL